jgi:hypothetical protein
MCKNYVYVKRSIYLYPNISLDPRAFLCEILAAVFQVIHRVAHSVLPFEDKLHAAWIVGC